MFHTIKLAFEMMTTTKPYLCTLMGPENYEFPWVPSPLHGDTTSDNNLNLLASATNSTDRHINENLYDQYVHYMGWANIASGAAGEGYHYGMYVNNLFATDFNTTYNDSVTYITNTTIYKNSAADGPNKAIHVYNPLDDNMFNDHLVRANIINVFNWAGLTQWANQNTSGRVSITADDYQDTHEAIPIYSGDSQNLLIWILQDTRSLGVYTVLTALSYDTLVLTNFPPQTYQLTWYNTTTGSVVTTVNNLTWNSSTDIVSTPIPPFVRDIVAIIKPE